MAEKEGEGQEELLLFSTLSILQLIKEAQQQHGLRHGDYQRYRAYCSRKIRRVRKSLKFTHAHKSVPKHPAKFNQRKVTLDIITDPRYLLVPLFEAERSWAHAMQLKQEATAEENQRKKFHLVARLKKAAKQASALETFCKTLNEVDAPTKLEASAYAAYITGCLHFETQAWPQAMEHFSTAKTIYERLSSVVKEGAGKELYGARVAELGPQLRFCAYNIGDESAIADLMNMRLKLDDSGSGGIGGDVERLISATLEKQQTGDALGADWAGRRLNLASPPRLAAFAAAHAQFQKDLEAEDADRAALHDKILIDCRDAIQAVRDEVAKTEPRLGSEAGQLLDYLSFLRLRLSNARYLLLCQAARGEEGKKGKPADLVRLLDTLVANLEELAEMGGVAKDKALAKEIADGTAYFRAWRCAAVAEAYAAQKKWPQALALFGLAAERAAEAGPGKADHGLGSLAELGTQVKGGRQRAAAGALLERSSGDNPFTGKTNGNATYDKPLAEDLETWRAWKTAELTGKAGLANPNALVRLPPPFRPMPGKPLFFDLALNHIKFPNLEAKIEPPQAAKSPPKNAPKDQGQSNKEGEAGGLASTVKGWFWGSK